MSLFNEKNSGWSTIPAASSIPSREAWTYRLLDTDDTFMEDDTLGDWDISTEGSRNVSLRVGDSSSQQDAGTPAGPIARSGQDAETQSKDPYAVLISEWLI